MLSPLVVPVHAEALPCFTREEEEKESASDGTDMWVDGGWEVGRGGRPWNLIPLVSLPLSCLLPCLEM